MKNYYCYNNNNKKTAATQQQQEELHHNKNDDNKTTTTTRRRKQRRSESGCGRRSGCASSVSPLSSCDDDSSNDELIIKGRSNKNQEGGVEEEENKTIIITETIKGKNKEEEEEADDDVSPPPSTTNNCVKVKLVVSTQSQGESRKDVELLPSSTVRQLKEKYFHQEVLQGLNIRLIFQGHQLEDWRTIGSYDNMKTGSVIHVYITQIVHSSQNHQNEAPDDTHEDVWSFLLYGAMGSILVYAWWWRMKTPSHFDYFSLCCLYIFGSLWIYVFFYFLLINVSKRTC